MEDRTFNTVTYRATALVIAVVMFAASFWFEGLCLRDFAVGISMGLFAAQADAWGDNDG